MHSPRQWVSGVEMKEGARARECTRGPLPPPHTRSPSHPPSTPTNPIPPIMPPHPDSRTLLTTLAAIALTLAATTLARALATVRARRAALARLPAAPGGGSWAVGHTADMLAPDFHLRLSQWKQQDYAVQMAKTPEEMASWLNPLAEAGVDVFHCSQRRFWEPEYEGSDLNFAGWARKVTGKPAITVGSVGLNAEFTASFRGAGAGAASLDDLLARLDADEFDLVGVGRAILADPLWAKKVKEGRTDELTDFDARTLAVLT